MDNWEIKTNGKGYIVTNGRTELPGWFTTELAAQSALRKYLNRHNDSVSLKEKRRLAKEEE